MPIRESIPASKNALHRQVLPIGLRSAGSAALNSRGLRALLRVQDGTVVWVTDPGDFVRRNIDSIVGAYKLVLTLSRFDPVKIGKNEAASGIAESELEKTLLKQGAAA